MPETTRKRFALGEHLTVTETVEAEPRNPEGTKRSITPEDVFFKSVSDEDYRREGFLLCLVYGNCFYVPVDKITRKH